MSARNKYEVVIGLEVHAQLLTKTKAYSSDENIYGAVPNTKTSVISLGHPGTLPKSNTNVIEYAVTLVGKTRPKSSDAPELVKKYIDWGAGPRASKNLILGAKTYAALHGKFSPDIEDVQKVAVGILRHRLIKNYKAEAEGLSIEDIIKNLF